MSQPTMTTPVNRLDRRAVVARLLSQRGEAIVVTGLGSPTYDVAACGDHDRNVYLWGAMGGCAVMALGIAMFLMRRRRLPAEPRSGESRAS